MAHLKEQFKEGSLIQAEGQEQVAEVVEGGLKGIEDPTDPSFLELGGFGSTQLVSSELFSQFQTGAAFQLHPAVNDAGELSIDNITAAGTAAEKLAGVQALQAAEAEKAAVGKVGAEEEKASLLQQFKDFFTQKESIADVRTKELEALGVPDVMKQQLSLISEISGLNTQLVTIASQEQAELDALETTPMRQSAFEGNRENIVRKFQRKKANLSAQIGAKAVTLQALQGFVGQARQLVNDVVNAVTFDQQLELNRITTFMSLNEDQIAQFDTTIKNFLNTTVTNAEKELEDRKDEVRSIMNLMVDAAEQGVTLAIDPRTATLEEASEMFTRLITPLAAEERKAALVRLRQLASVSDEPRPVISLNLSRTEENDLRAAGLNTASTDVKEFFISALSPKERSQYITNIAAEKHAGIIGAQIDPITWKLMKDAEEEKSPNDLFELIDQLETLDI